MKAVLRLFVFCYISLLLLQSSFAPFRFGGNTDLLLIGLALLFALFYVLVKPLFRVVSIPTSGVAFFILSIGLALVILYLVSFFVPSFGVLPISTPSLNLVIVTIPSFTLSAGFAAIFSVFAVSAIFEFLMWLSLSKH